MGDWFVALEYFQPENWAKEMPSDVMSFKSVCYLNTKASRLVPDNLNLWTVNSLILKDMAIPSGRRYYRTKIGRGGGVGELLQLLFEANRRLSC
jgi:hypothetical protein